MSKKILKALPEIYSFKRPDYSRFMVKEGASGLMRDNWSALGDHLRASAFKVGQSVNKSNGSIAQRQVGTGGISESKRDRRGESRTFAD